MLVLEDGQKNRVSDAVSLQAGLPSLQHIIVAGAAPAGCVSLEDLMSGGAGSADAAPTSSDDDYLLLYTSGTTASPKGVPHIYSRFLNNAFVSAQEMGIDPASRLLSLAPMTHLYGLFTLHMSLAAGAASVLVPAFSPENRIDRFAEQPGDACFMPPLRTLRHLSLRMR